MAAFAGAGASVYRQVHLFAGIGVWSYSLRLAGWGDDRPVWTASFPCQPFSAAGRRLGTEDERHLWPVGLGLIAKCLPPVLFGEQVSSPDGLGWWDAVSADMENAGYAVGAADLCAPGVGAPHIRQRLYWMANSPSGGGGARLRNQGPARERGLVVANDSGAGGLDDDDGAGLEGQRSGYTPESGRVGALRSAPATSEPVRLGHPDGDRAGRERRAVRSPLESEDGEHSPDDVGAPSAAGRPSPVNGFWRNADWLGCRDGKWRPVEPGTFPLAHGAAARVVRLRGYGDAIVAPLAAEWVRAGMEAIADVNAVEELI